MTTTDAPSKFRYEGNGSTDTFAFTGRIFAAEDLVVEIITRATDALVDTLTLTTDYAVTINGPSSASVTVTAPNIPSASQDIQIRRALDKTQSLRLPTGTVFPAANVETALDKVTAIAQEIQDELDNTLKYPPNVSGISDVSLPAPVDGAALIFDGTTGKIAASITYISDAVAQAVEEATEGVTGTSLITATSTTSRTVTGTGEKTWTIQAGRGFALGQRLRAASDDGTKINEGKVTAYSGTSLTINVDYVSGSGTHADWNISVAGDRGAAGAGTGDMLAANNLSEVNAAAAFNTIKQAASETATGVVELATTAEAITGSDTTRAVTAAGVKAAIDNNGGVVKAWCVFNGATTGTNAPLGGEGVTSVTRHFTGSYTVNLSDTYASTDQMCPIASCIDTLRGMTPITSKTTTTVRFETSDSSTATNFDPTRVHFILYGTLA